MLVRGIRGATTVTTNDADEILLATTELLNKIVQENKIDPEHISHVWITMTQDLDATFPARAVRTIPGWELVPIMCSLEIPVAGSLPMCIRIMLNVNTDKAQAEIHHVYLNEAAKLRPDLVDRTQTLS
ncbi:chorismate mutase [Paenibacillus sp. ACRRX]|uniref:chorismate mutase n=1 Tax=unclassified Paenibacillus TaxID=185978 RepID=UPI001EF5EF61|nr:MULTISPECIES: chorismate mutase [unclassified Paenibacillus]MCG7406457.1 chorismate mutase [Paenibacillus sp. ACRRX]MDK8179489.1 chorismate mutase [Paenibacillus sp. UMB4589-SE434]